MNIFFDQVEQVGEVEFVPSQADINAIYGEDVCRECGIPLTNEHSPVCDSCSFEQWVVEMENAGMDVLGIWLGDISGAVPH